MPDHRLRQARLATAALFLLFGFALGAWTASIPAIKAGLRIDDAQLSLALLGLAAGAISGMQLAGRLVDRYGSTRVMLPVALVEGALLVPTAIVPGLSGLAIALFVFGVSHGVLNIAMNANAIEVQRAYGRPILSSFHAVYSVGGFLGASFGGLFAGLGFAPTATFTAVALIAVAVTGGVAAWRLRTAPARSTVESSAGSGRLTGVVLLGGLVFAALVGEGAAADWSSVYLRDHLGSSAGFAAAAYAAFAIGMTASRMVGDRLAQRLGPVVLARFSALIAAVGLGGALLAATPWAGVLGFGCLGAGVACIAPLACAAAGARNPSRSGSALARVLAIGYAGFLAGPVLIGAASTAVGLPAALTIPALLALVVALLAPALAPRPSTVEPARAVG
jgi:predicted MFS family arabinose efflux permease